MKERINKGKVKGRRKTEMKESSQSNQRLETNDRKVKIDMESQTLNLGNVLITFAGSEF